MIVKFWKYFDKKGLSTARPTAAADLESDLSVYMPCDMIHPRLKMKSDAGRFYYAYIVDFGRYYYLDSISYEGGLQIAAYTLDYLASFRTEIGATRCMIERSSQMVNENLIDPYRAVEPEIKYIREVTQNVLPKGEGYLLQYTGSGGVHTVWIGEKPFKKLMSALWLTWGKIEGMSQVIQTAIDPAQYILSVQKCLLGVEAFVDVNTAVPIPIILGNMVMADSEGVQISAFEVSESQQKNVVIDLPKHPQASKIPFVKAAPYSCYSIKIPGAGWIDLNANDIYAYELLTVRYTFDGINGKFRAEVMAGQNVIGETMGSSSIPYAFSAASVDVGGAIMGGISSILSVATANITGAVNGIGSAIGTIFPTVTTRGKLGSAIGVNEQVEILLRYQTVGELDSANQGEPLAKVGTVGKFRGFVKCADANPVMHGATKNEIDTIIELMNGGFYFE